MSQTLERQIAWRRAERFNRHGITLSGALWLYDVQHRMCPVCLQPLRWNDFHVDHWHGCTNRENHRSAAWKDHDRGCPQCVRGLLHPMCNSMLGVLASYPHLHVPAISEYLTRRPFAYLSIMDDRVIHAGAKRTSSERQSRRNKHVQRMFDFR